MDERKIDVTATLKHGPSTRAEFLVSVMDNDGGPENYQIRDYRK